MTDELNDKALDKRIAALMNRGPQRRGRPPLGFTKAMQYSDEVWKLRRAGASPWRAVVEVGSRNGKTPEHISACMKMIADTSPQEYIETDRTEDTD
jgi:hypothetical protein